MFSSCGFFCICLPFCHEGPRNQGMFPKSFATYREPNQGGDAKWTPQITNAIKVSAFFLLKSFFEECCKNKQTEHLRKRFSTTLRLLPLAFVVLDPPVAPLCTSTPQIPHRTRAAAPDCGSGSDASERGMHAARASGHLGGVSRANHPSSPPLTVAWFLPLAIPLSV